MNRRNFFKVVTGFVAGIFASSAKSKAIYKSGPPGPTIIPEECLEPPWGKLGCKDCYSYKGCSHFNECLDILKKQIEAYDKKVSQDIYGDPDMLYSRKRSGTQFVYNSRCNCPEQRMIQNGSRIIIACANHEPYFLYPDGTIGEIYSYHTGEKLV